VQNIFEVAYLRCEYTDELAPVEKRQLHERQQCLELGISLFDQAVARDQLPSGTDTRLASHLLYAYISGVMRDWVQAPDTFDLKSAAPQLVDVFLAGLKAAPPRTLAKAA
jgi:TetR/AcrR family acrAB operon transcriptional repressor